MDQPAHSGAGVQNLLLKMDMTLRRLYPLLVAVATLSAAACDTRGSGIIGIVRTPSGLTSLELSVGNLTPSFAQTRTSYTATVPNAVSAITVTATATSSGSSILINGNTVQSGQPSPPIALQVGPNTINVSVTTADGITTKQYAIVVTRQA